jgi:hypothetical protein
MASRAWEAGIVRVGLSKLKDRMSAAPNIYCCSHSFEEHSKLLPSHHISHSFTLHTFVACAVRTRIDQTSILVIPE